MDVIFAIVSCLVFAAVSAGVWYGARRPWVRFQLLRPPGHSGTGRDHPPDLSMHLSVFGWKVMAAAALATTGLLVTLVVVAMGYGMIAQAHAQIVPRVLREVGIPASAQYRSDVTNLVRMPEGDQDGSVQVLMRALTGSKEPTILTRPVRDLAYQYMVVEEGGSAKAAFADLLAQLVSADPQAKRAISRYVDQKLTTTSVPVTAAEFLTGFQFAPGLQGYHMALERQFARVAPGSHELVTGIYDRMRSQVAQSVRIKKMLVDYIQGATFFVYFWVLIMLGLRSSVLEDQVGTESLFRRFVSERRATLHDLVENRKKAGITEADELIAHLPRPDPSLWASQLKVVGAFLEAAGDQMLFRATVYRRVLLELARTGSLQDARMLLESTCRRTERRVEKVEYSGIEYAIYAMPSLGFIGTVWGVGASLGNADKVVRATDAASQGDAISAVTSVLGVAFDTTLVALVCSIIAVYLAWSLRAAESKFVIDTERLVAERTLTL